MRLKQVLDLGIKILKRVKLSSAVIDAEVLLSYVINKSKEYLYTYPEEKISIKQLTRYKKLLKKRASGIPLAYLTKSKEFYGLNFYVDKRVLIPRPETEIMIDEILKHIKRTIVISILDIGTGSGCIAVTLAKKLSLAKIYAVDISKSALAVARKNASRHQVAKKNKFIQGNLMEPFERLKIKFDIICANLPYLSTKKAKQLIAEPLKALDGGQTGLNLINQFLKQAPSYLQPKGKIYLEINPEQKGAVKKTIKKYFPKKRVLIKKDLANLDRLIVIN